jgi:hypothetical protein
MITITSIDKKDKRTVAGQVCDCIAQGPVAAADSENAAIQQLSPSLSKLSTMAPCD